MKKIVFFIVLFYALVFVCAFYPRSYTYDVDKAVKALDANAHDKSQGLCAQYVRRAIEAGGASTWGYPYTAKHYLEYLPYLDFEEVDKKGYSPIKGDIIVWDAVEGHEWGHIAMWDGKQWVSDFKQRGKIVAKEYGSSNKYTYFRMKKKNPKRYFSFEQHYRGFIVTPLGIWFTDCLSDMLYQQE